MTIEPILGRFAVARLEPSSVLPGWTMSGDIWCVARTPDEISVVCREEMVPDWIQSERGWRALRVAGTIDFSEVGVLARLAQPLAAAGISIFAFSTFDTDYLLVREDRFEQALQILGS